MILSELLNYPPFKAMSIFNKISPLACLHHVSEKLCNVGIEPVNMHDLDPHRVVLLAICLVRLCSAVRRHLSVRIMTFLDDCLVSLLSTKYFYFHYLDRYLHFDNLGFNTFSEKGNPFPGGINKSHNRSEDSSSQTRI